MSPKRTSDYHSTSTNSLSEGCYINQLGGSHVQWGPTWQLKDPLTDGIWPRLTQQNITYFQDRWTSNEHTIHSLIQIEQWPCRLEFSEEQD